MSTSYATTLGLTPTFGFGDRLGLATSGHLDALEQRGGPIRGIFAQQSIREMDRTSRTPEQVMSAAYNALHEAGYSEPWGSDADHLKTEKHVDITAAAGFTFFTIDPSDHVDAHADDYDPATLAQKFKAVADDLPWIGQYQGKTIEVPDGPAIEFDETTVQRAAVKYGKAIQHALDLAAYIKRTALSQNRDYEIELSVDETPQPTTAAEHYIIADQCRQAEMKLVSLAPRYVGEFEKGVDFKGDFAAFEKSLNDHAAIARFLGPYKLSLHSGSDKLSIYAAFARATRGQCHVKTAGTSYLEALRVVAKHDEALFREIIDYARTRYDTDKATYHVEATAAGVPAPKDIADARELEKLYLEHWEDVPEGTPGRGFTQLGRQILHCTFGSVLTHEKYAPALKQILTEHPDTHREILSDHFGRHLDALRAGMAETAEAR